MTTVTEKLETAKKWVRSITMPAAITVAAMTTGCATTGNQGPQYMGYLNPNDKDFAVQKEAYINKGMAVEATFITGPDGNQMAVYGVREKSFMERTNDHLNQYEGIYKNVDRLATLGLRTTDTIYGIKTEHDLNKIRKEEGRQTNAMYQQNGLLQSAIQTLNSSKNSNCNQ